MQTSSLLHKWPLFPKLMVPVEYKIIISLLYSMLNSNSMLADLTIVCLSSDITIKAAAHSIISMTIVPLFHKLSVTPSNRSIVSHTTKILYTLFILSLSNQICMIPHNDVYKQH